MKIYTTEEIRNLIAAGNKKKIYDSKYWRFVITPRILERDNNECQECKKEGKITIKQHNKKLDIHHIKELEEYPELAYEESNLLTVCVIHHNILDNKHIKKNNSNKFTIPERW